MITHQLLQGSPDWLAYRTAHDNASDAPAMMGESSYKTRDQLIAEVATGIVPDVDAATQRLFNSGHRFEALARPRAETLIGQDLYPCTGSIEGSRLSASFDGLTMSEDVAFEHKRLNQRLRAAFSDMETVAPEYRKRQSGRCLPLEYQIQMEQQCAVSGCEKVLFMATHWADDDTLLEQLHCWYYPNLELRARIVAGWEQFHKEVAAYVAPEKAAVVNVTAKLRDALPALVFDAKGEVTACNVDEFKVAVLDRINTVNMELVSDQDFADGDADAKWLRDVSAGMKNAVQRVRSGMVTVNEVLNVLEQLDELAAKKARDIEKLVKARKEEIRGEIVTSGIAAFRDHMASLDTRLGKPYMPTVPADFAGAIKGKRTVDSLRDAVNTELARAKIAANEIADRIQLNLTSLREMATAHAFLFADTPQLVMKANDDLLVLIKSRIAEHEAKETARLEAERERIRAEEQAKAQREAEAKAAADTEAAARRAAAPAPAPQPEQAPALTQQAQAAIEPVAMPAANVVPMRAAPAPAAAPATAASLKLGTITERLGFALTADFLANTLGFAPAATDRASKLYHEADFPHICAALVRHVESVQALAAA